MLSHGQSAPCDPKLANGGSGQVGATRDMVAQNGTISSGRRLSSWKEIAVFVGRDERTVKRWEGTRGLPVRRVPGAGHASVFAYADEIEAWLRGRASQEPANSVPDAETQASKIPASQLAKKRIASGALVLFAIAIVVAAAAYLVQLKRPAKPLQDRAPDPAAAEFYRAGLHEWQTRTPSGLARAVADFNRAIERDPRYASAYAGLADAYNLQGEFTTVPADQGFPKAAAAAERAIALDPSLATAHAALAFADFYWYRDVTAAQREFRRALALDPGSAVAHHWYATFLMTIGESDAALAEIDRAQNLDSESTAIPADKALILFHAGKNGEAVRLLTQLEDEQPDFASTHRYLATIRLAEGADAAYLRELRLMAQSRHDARGVELAEAGAKGLTSGGHVGMLRAMLGVQRTLYASGKESAYALAMTYAGLGDVQGEMDYLAISVARRDADNIAIKIDPPFAALRNDRRFAALLAKAGLVSRFRRGVFAH